MLPGLAGAVGGAPAPFAVSYVSTANNTTSLSTYTFASQAIGAPDASRHVVVVALGDANSTSRVFNSATVGGAAMTREVQYTGFYPAAIFTSTSPFTSGTTADIVVTCSSTLENIAIFVFTLTGKLDLPAASDTLVDTATSGAIDVVPGGVIIAGAMNLGSTADLTWTNMTEAADVAVESMNRYTAATHLGTATATRTISISAGDLIIAASWNP